MSGSAILGKHELTKRVKMKALELGFVKVGITSADDFSEHAAELMVCPRRHHCVGYREAVLAGLSTGSRFLLDS